MIYECSNSDFEFVDFNLKKFDDKLNIEKILSNKLSYVYVYKIGNTNVGFIVFSKYFERIEIDYIYVTPKYRNQGIGSKLVSFIGEKYDDIYNITLEVDTSNYIAINLYKKIGFDVVAIRKNYYKNGSDAFLMERK